MENALMRCLREQGLLGAEKVRIVFLTVFRDFEEML